MPQEKTPRNAVFLLAFRVKMPRFRVSHNRIDCEYFFTYFKIQPLIFTIEDIVAELQKEVDDIFTVCVLKDKVVIKIVFCIGVGLHRRFA